MNTLEQAIELAERLLPDLRFETDRARAKAVLVTLKAHQQAAQDAELPPLPEAWIEDMSAADPASRLHFAADQMTAYARAAIAAHQARQAVPRGAHLYIDRGATSATQVVGKIKEARIAEHDVDASRDFEDADWYITVTGEDGLRSYNGHWRESADKSAEDVMIEAARGSMIQLAAAPTPEASQPAPEQVERERDRVRLLTEIQSDGEGLRYELDCLINNGVNTFRVYDEETESFMGGDWLADPVAAIDAGIDAAREAKKGDV